MTRQDVIDRIVSLAAVHTPDAAALAGRFDPPDLARGAASVVVLSEDAAGTSDVDVRVLAIAIWVLVPLGSDAPEDYRDDYEAAAVLAETTLRTIELALEDDAGHTWAAARRTGRVDQRLSRPQPGLLCAEATATYLFAHRAA